MQARQVKNAAARQIVVDRDLGHVQVGVFDIDGILRGKYLSRDKFLAALDQGFGLCDVLLGWDSQDQFYDNVAAAQNPVGCGAAPQGFTDGQRLVRRCLRGSFRRHL